MVSSAEIMQMVEGQTVASTFLETVGQYGSGIALRAKTDDENWRELTYDQYADAVARVAAAYKAKGIGKGDRIVLMMRNIPEFHILDTAAYFVGATPVSIYNSSSAEQIAYLAGHCGAKLAIVEGSPFLERLEEARADLPSLERIGVVDAAAASEGIFTYDELMAFEPLDLSEAAGDAHPDDLATVIYTSGTTGPPKGVMITHRNLAWVGESMTRIMPDMDWAGKRTVSYLPMAHIAERVVSHYNGIALGLEVTCCPDPTAIAVYAREVHPHIMFGVPRVWEKVYAGLNAAMGADADFKATFDAAVEEASPLREAVTWERATPDQVARLNEIDGQFFAGLRAVVGLDECEAAITGAAPLPAEMIGWLRAIGVPLSEVYGMSENTGPMTWILDKVKVGSVGPAIPGCEMKLIEDGEVVCRGGHVFRGYLNDPEKTADALDDDGWLHTGDIGELDEDGYLRIVDRKKELIITAGGKNVSPANLEAALKMIPLVGQALVVGDKRKFVAGIVVLDPDVAPVWAQGQGIEFDDLPDLATKPEVRAAIETGLPGVMEPFSNAEKVKKVAILGDEWLPDSDVLTPTSKLKRRGVHARYESEIEDLYAD